MSPATMQPGRLRWGTSQPRWGTTQPRSGEGARRAIDARQVGFWWPAVVLCNDDSVLDAAFQMVEYVAGQVVRGRADPEALGGEQVVGG